MSSARAWSERGGAYGSSAPHLRGPSLPKLLALARSTSGDVCLDLGTGTGHTAAHLARVAAKVTGLDPAEGMLKAAREAYGGVGNLEFVLAPAQNTGLASNSFDLITARHTLHHHPDLAATLGEVTRLLRPGGRLVLVDEVTPDAEVDVWYDALERTRDYTHVRAYSMSEWQAFIAEAGLEWVVGDAHTVYTLDVAPWVERMDLSPKGAENVYALFREADAHARRTFNIVYKGGEAVRFDMPMALILAVKPSRNVT